MIIVCSRFIMYKDFLDAHAEYDKVFVSDVRDVIFQGDIFKVYPGQDKFISYSNCRYFIKDEPTNTQWIKNNFSDAEYDKIKNNRVAAAPMLYGTRKEMMIFLLSMIKFFKPQPLWGDDQAIVNYIVYNRLIPVKKIFESTFDKGDFVNLDSIYPQIVNDKIATSPNKFPKVLHQWYLYDHLNPLVDTFYREKDFQPDENFTDFQSLLDQISCLVQHRKFNAATKIFLDFIFHESNVNSYADKILKIAQLILKCYTVDAEILLFVVQKTLVNIFNSNDFTQNLDINKFVKQIELMYKLCINSEKNFHFVNPSFKNFVKNMLITFAEVLYAKNQAQPARKYIKYLADWGN